MKSVQSKRALAARSAAPVLPHVLFKACSDPTRLRILHMLRAGERCVCDLVDVLKVPQPKVSRHLAYLKKAGLVESRKDGLWIHYFLPKATTPLHKKLLAALPECAALDLRLNADALKLVRLKSNETRCR